jgi:hypothetical protein
MLHVRSFRAAECETDNYLVVAKVRERLAVSKETNQNLIQEEINRRLNLGNACYCSVQNLLSSCLLSKNIKIRIYKTIILRVVLYGCVEEIIFTEER